MGHLLKLNTGLQQFWSQGSSVVLVSVSVNVVLTTTIDSLIIINKLLESELMFILPFRGRQLLFSNPPSSSSSLCGTSLKISCCRYIECCSSESDQIMERGLYDDSKEQCKPTELKSRTTHVSAARHMLLNMCPALWTQHLHGLVVSSNPFTHSCRE